MSRATVDLQSVRFFLGYGLVFFTQSALTILLAAVAMFLVDPVLAALSLLPVPFVVSSWPPATGAARGRRCRRSSSGSPSSPPTSRRTSPGVRVVKAFAAEPRQLAALRAARVARVFDQSMIATRLRAFYNPFIGFLPSVGLAVILLRRRAPGDQRARSRSATSPRSTRTC